MFDGIFKGFNRLGARAAPDESLPQEMSILLHGRDSYALDVAGTSRHRDEIRAVMKGKAAPGRRSKCIATLQLEPDTSAGRASVAVFIEGVMVGHFPRHLSTQYCEWLKAWKLGRARVHCHALIQTDASATAPDGVEHRVKLDIELPFKMTAIQA